MTSPLSGQIASLIYTGMKALFLDATLERDTVAAGSPDVSFDPPAPTTATYDCKAISEKRNVRFGRGAAEIEGTHTVLILANSLDVDPLPGDRVTVTGSAIVTISKDGVSIDPARACWTCIGSI